jgi:hypothetical protein
MNGGANSEQRKARHRPGHPEHVLRVEDCSRRVNLVDLTLGLRTGLILLVAVRGS